MFRTIKLKPPYEKVLVEAARQFKEAVQMVLGSGTFPLFLYSLYSCCTLLTDIPCMLTISELVSLFSFFALMINSICS